MADCTSSAFEPSQEQALAVFNHAAQEIRFFKGQQWLVTNYALITYGALAATPQLIDDTCLKAVASALCAAVVALPAGAAGWVLYSLDEALDKERRRMDKARCKLPMVAKLHANGRVDGSVIWILRGAVVVGALLAIGINISRAPWVAACLSAGAV